MSTAQEYDLRLIASTIDDEIEYEAHCHTCGFRLRARGQAIRAHDQRDRDRYPEIIR